MDHLQTSDLDITTANAGARWLEYKATALRRRMMIERRWRASLVLNVVLGAANVVLLALLFPRPVLTALAVGAALWLCGVAIFAAMVLDAHLRARNARPGR